MDNITDKGLHRRVKLHVSAKEHVFFAIVQPGFEHTLASEMMSAGLKVRPELIEGGVEFSGRIDDLFRACLMLRGASRIVMRLGTFRSAQFHQLEKDVSDFPWELFLPCGCRPVFRTTASKSMIWHTDKLEGIISSKIAERMSLHSKPESFSATPPAITQTLIIRNHKDRCSISLDASKALLHKRCGEKFISTAPLRETTAALILMEAGIGNYDVLVDPMCGSGTFSVEAAGIFSGALPSADREFPFFAWPCFRRNHFEYMKKTLGGELKSLSGKSVITGDIDPKAVDIAKRNVPVYLSDFIKPVVQDFFSLKSDSAEEKRVLVVLNPPYGKRIDQGNTALLYRQIGEKLQGDFPHCGYAVIVPGTEAEQAFNCRYDRKVLFMNGGIRVAVLFCETVAVKL
ncbi:MAG TPA: hypothetical protein PK514_01445 [Spirochaetota bacterium]|nr:hypothetical protein [Spirochaetota bacterium]